MLPLEAIGVVGFLYLFFMYGTWRAIRARRAVRAKVKAKGATMETVPDTAKQSV